MRGASAAGWRRTCTSGICDHGEVTPRPCRTTLVHRRFGVCAIALCGGTLATRGVAQSVVLEVALILALASVVRARRSLRPAYRRPWDGLFAGLLVLLLYSVVWFVTLRGTTGHTALVVVPVLTFGSFVVASAGILLRGNGRAQAGLVDSGIVAVALALAVWAVGPGPGLAAAPLPVQLASLASVLALGVVLGCLSAVARTDAVQGPSLRYLLLAAGATTVGFGARIATTTPEEVDGAWWIATLWALALCATAAATWHPDIALIGERPTRRPGLTTAALWALGAALAVGPAVSIVQAATGRVIDGGALGVGMLVILLLVLLRIGMLVRAREDAEARLARLARRDELTGLANRRELSERLSRALDRVTAGESPAVTVMFCDLDGFKGINDAYGHRAGDAVLAIVGRRLSSALRAEDVVARFGGDEFVVVAEGDPVRVPRETLRRVTDALADPIRVAGVRHHVRASTGIVVSTSGHDATAADLLAAADAEMYSVKRAQRAGHTLARARADDDRDAALAAPPLRPTGTLDT